MWFGLLNLEARRRRLAKRAPPGPLREFLRTPFPAPGSDWRATDFVALDVETTGLDPNKDAIVSVGLVGMHGPHIDLSTAWHRIVQLEQPLSAQSVVIHRLTDDTVAKGEPLRQVVTEVLQLLAGKVLLAHHARMEFGFLATACAQLFGAGFISPVVDTQRLAQQWLERRDKHYTVRDLRLFNLRERYNLPRYQAHNALSDALAAAELFAAQMAERSQGQPLALKKILIRP